MKIVVTGSRHWTNRQIIEQEIDRWATHCRDKGELLTIVNGKAPNGADAIARDVALSSAKVYEVVDVPAEWDKYGRSAGHKRNKEMLVKYEPDLVLAFRARGKSNGTDHCISEARKRGIRVDMKYDG